MRVGINCRSFLKPNYTGIGRYAYNLVRCLSEIDKTNEYLLYVQKKLFDFRRKAPHFPADNFESKIDLFNRGIDRTLGKIDIYHSPCPDFLKVNNAKIIVSIHDVIHRSYSQGHTAQTLELTEKKVQETIKKASKIICCSKSTVDDLEEFYGIDRERMSLIYQGVDKEVFYPLEDRERKKAKALLKEKGVLKPFILFVGTIEPRKNLGNLLKAFASLKSQKKYSGNLVVIGQKGWRCNEILPLVDKLNLQDDVLFQGYLSNKELCYFYNLTDVFVLPSFYEGFGFPIVEAFSCGAPVITSNLSSCEEIAQEAAITINPEHPDAIAEAVYRIVKDSHLRKELIRHGLNRAEEFSFMKVAEETLEVYEEVYKLK